jgi:hypothetical protein
MSTTVAIATRTARRFWFEVFVDGRKIAEEYAIATAPSDQGEKALVRACQRRAEELCWVVADGALDSKEPLSRSRVTCCLMGSAVSVTAGADETTKVY